MVNIVIYGLNITVSENNIHIENSYMIEERNLMKDILTELYIQLKESHITMDTPFNHRTIPSMINEWVSHNNYYKLGLWKDRVMSVDLNYPQPWYMPFIYWLTSRIVL